MKQLTQADRRRIAPKLLAYWTTEAIKLGAEEMLVEAVYAIVANNPKGIELGAENLRKCGQVANQLGEGYDTMVQFYLELQEKRFEAYKINVLECLNKRQPRGKKGNRKQQ